MTLPNIRVNVPRVPVRTPQPQRPVFDNAPALSGQEMPRQVFRTPVKFAPSTTHWSGK